MRAALILLLLAGCATKPEVRQPATIEVDKAVAVTCIKAAPERPVYVTEQLPPTATDIQFGDALAVDWVRSRAYEKELEIAVRACVMP
jgi:uncharacterized lipoprotein